MRILTLLTWRSPILVLISAMPDCRHCATKPSSLNRFNPGRFMESTAELAAALRNSTIQHEKKPVWVSQAIEVSRLHNACIPKSRCLLHLDRKARVKVSRRIHRFPNSTCICSRFRQRIFNVVRAQLAPSTVARVALLSYVWPHRFRVERRSLPHGSIRG